MLAGLHSDTLALIRSPTKGDYISAYQYNKWIANNNAVLYLQMSVERRAPQRTAPGVTGAVGISAYLKQMRHHVHVALTGCFREGGVLASVD